MATRLYFTSAVMTLAPAFDASWEGVSTSRRSLSPTRLGTPFESVTLSEASASTTFDGAVCQFISPPLSAQTVSGNVKAILRTMESATDADFRSQLLIRIRAFDGASFRGTLLAHDASALSNEWAASLTNRKFPLNWAGSGTALSSVAAQEGDRIVVEIGYRAHNSTTGPRVGTIEFGDSSTTDCAEDEVSTTQNNPWIEFSNTLTFSSVLSARGLGSPIASVLGPGNNIPQGHGTSYALAGGNPEASLSGGYRVAHQKSGVVESGRLSVASQIRQGRYGVETTTLEGQTSTTLRSPIGGGGFPSGSGSVDKFKMRALANPGPGYVTWVVSDTPDFAGAQAPSVIQPGTVVVSDYWTET